MRQKIIAAAIAAAAVVAAPQALASEELNFDAYRQMLADGNPAELFEMEGEELWTTARGPKNATLEKCDLGLGANVVVGAAAQMPRYFADTDKVQDLESRLMHCMDALQGIPSAEIINGSFLKGERAKVAALVAYVVGQSKGKPIQVDLAHPKMKEMYAMGEKTFYYRTGAMDFACSSCHSQDGKRIRATSLPNITTSKGAAEGWGSWPAYRVSNSQFWTMQHRLWDCFRQQRTAEPVFGSDVTIALSTFMAGKGNGHEAVWPGVKR
ncbi:MAG: sulfur oxidation c-type cytochrome SoxA [Azoarcus sp.]|nr:sulfur oxidation c-type cytochrome SoxA [Azoarcus sp.]